MKGRMSKVRINDLARELEVKSKAILDTLPLVGVTEKKTHSSSLEEHEAEKVRVYIRSAEGSSQAGKSSSRASRGEEEIKTKIDLSNISRPGDVLRAITQKKETVAPPIAPRPVVASPAAPAPEKVVAVPPATVSRPTTVAPPALKPAAPISPVAAAPTAVPTRPVVAPPVQSAPVSAAPVVAPPVRPVAPPPAVQPPSAIQPPTAPVASPPATSASAPSAPPVATRPSPPPPPAPRMIVPQTGPRPVYKAPVRPTPPPVQPGVPIGGAMRAAPGRPVPGQPIFQRRPPAEARRVRRFVRASVGRCIPRGLRQQARVRSV